MSAEKRPASDEPGAGQMLVKRQKPTSTALARREGADSGAVIPSVGRPVPSRPAARASDATARASERELTGADTDAAHQQP